MALNLALITLQEKYQRISKNKKKYYLLTYNLQKTLTKRLFELIGETKPTLKTNRKPLFLFDGKTKWARFLKLGAVYLVEYEVRKEYLHVKDWKILGDKMSVERSFRVVSLMKR